MLSIIVGIVTLMYVIVIAIQKLRLNAMNVEIFFIKHQMTICVEKDAHFARNGF